MAVPVVYFEPVWTAFISVFAKIVNIKILLIKISVPEKHFFKNLEKEVTKNAVKVTFQVF